MLHGLVNCRFRQGESEIFPLGCLAAINIIEFDV